MPASPGWARFGLGSSGSRRKTGIFIPTDSCRARHRQQRRGLDRVEKRELPGNDASWYRALLGDKESVLDAIPESESLPEPEVADKTDPATQDHPLGSVTPPDEHQPPAVADHQQKPVEFPPEDNDVKPTEEPGEAAVGTPTGDLAAARPPSHDHEPLDNTSEMVGQLWTASETSSPLDDWAPDDMDSKVGSARPFRWTSLITIVALVGLIAVAFFLLPTFTQNRADTHREMLTTALSELRGELPETQSSLAVATDPASTPTELTALSTQLTVLAARASSLDEAATTDVPSALPLTSSDPLDELEPIRQQLAPLGSVAAAIQRRISNLASYRTSMAGFLDLPDLPIAADSSGQAELRVTLAAAQANSASILAELPDDPALADHRDRARDLNERFATWQVDFLEALRAEDSVAARSLLAELGDGLALLDSELVAPLAEIRRDTDIELIALAGSIDSVVGLANGGATTP